MDYSQDELLKLYLRLAGLDFRGMKNLKMIERIKECLNGSIEATLRSNQLLWTYNSTTDEVTIDHRYLDVPPAVIKWPDLVKRLESLEIPRSNGVTKLSPPKPRIH